MSVSFDQLEILLSLKKSVIPSGGGPTKKAPIVDWTVYQTRLPTKDELNHWFHNGLNPTLWGIVTGSVSGIVVFDADDSNTMELFHKAGLAPHVKTKRGEHYYFKHPGLLLYNRVGLLNHLDLRGDGGFVNCIGSNENACYEMQVVPDNDSLYNFKQLPAEVIAAMAKPQPLTTETISADIPQSQRNATLTSLGGSMRRRGLQQAVIETALLEVNRKQCKPPLPDKEVLIIARSVSRYKPDELLTSQSQTLTNSQNTDNTDISDKIDITDKADNPSRGKIIWRLVDEWLELHQGERFELDTICRHLDIRTREDRHAVVKKLSYEVAHEKLEKSDTPHTPLYTYINHSYKKIDWVNANIDEILDIKWPYGIEDGSQFGFDGRVRTSPGDVIVVVGVSNMGKTTFCQNMLWNNMDKFPCTLMGNEYTPAKFKRRVSNMKWADPLDLNGQPKFELIERRDQWKDVIRPDNINIIDWISLNDAFYNIGKVIEGIQSKLKKGIVIIALQKDENKKLGLGGHFSEDLASVYLAIDYNRMTVVKAKEWHEFNPNGKMYGFEIVNFGTQFHHIRQIKKCGACWGTGKYRGGRCDNCQGSGFVDDV